MSTSAGTEAAISITTPAGDGVLTLQSIRGEERLSGPFHFFLEMTSSKSDIDFSTIVGKAATVKLYGGNGAVRYINGIMTRFVHAGTSRRITTYLAEMRPWFWLLTLTSDHRVFQAKSAIDIITEIFGSDYPDFRNATTGTPTVRDYCVQYGETTFAFVSRLLEEEGIHYFFEHEDGKHTMVLANDTDAHKTFQNPNSVTYRTAAMEGSQEEVITSVLFEQHVAANGVALEDYEFTTPSLELLASSDSANAGSLKLYEYPGGYATKDAGDAIARLRIEAQEAEAKVLRGSSRVRGFTPGFTFQLTDHDRTDVNATYLLRAVSHVATYAEYWNDFDAIPSTVPFRPMQTVAKPRIHGAQTAVVVGKKDEEIWTDKYGRVKVQFHWDRKGKNDENSSCWVRVAQMLAGKSFGSWFIPRIGQEVIVTFLDGDPDRPIVTGSVYNATQTLPYTLPDDQAKSTIKTQSTKKPQGESEVRYNEIRFDDTWKAEELFVRAQNNMTVGVEFDRTTTVKNNDTLTVTKARSVTVSEGDDSHTVTKGKRTVTVSEGDDALTVTKGKRDVTVTAGDETLTVGGKRTLAITGDEAHTSKAKYTHEVTGDYVLKITGGLTIQAKSVSIKADTTVESEAGTSLTTKGGTAVKIESGGTLEGKGATAKIDGGGMLELKGGMVKIN